jgi:hypothetical protein
MYLDRNIRYLFHKEALCSVSLSRNSQSEHCSRSVPAAGDTATKEMNYQKWELGETLPSGVSGLRDSAVLERSIASVN